MIQCNRGKHFPGGDGMLTDAELDAFDGHLDTLDARIAEITAGLAETRARLEVLAS
jgi:hypothetical protein